MRFLRSVAAYTLLDKKLSDDLVHELRIFNVRESSMARMETVVYQNNVYIRPRWSSKEELDNYFGQLNTA